MIPTLSVPICRRISARDWFRCQAIDADPAIDRTDYLYVRETEIIEDIPQAFFEALVQYFKLQRLMPEEIEQWDGLIRQGKKPEGEFREKLLLAFAEGVVGEDFRTLDGDSYLGTFAEIVFKWIRQSFLEGHLVDSEPRLLTNSSRVQGIDYFEILGDKTDINSLYFILWEVKGTDGAVTSRTDEIYAQHKTRSGRLLRGLQVKLADQYEHEDEPILRQFASYLMDYWLTNSPQKHLGGCVVHATNPGIVFSTFAAHFPDLAYPASRQVCLVQVPCFCEVRTKVWELIWGRIGLNPVP